MKDRAYGADSRQGNGEDCVESHCSTAYFLKSDYNLNCTAKIRNLDRSFVILRYSKVSHGFLNREQPLGIVRPQRLLPRQS
jgi:hypothetical protein